MIKNYFILSLLVLSILSCSEHEEKVQQEVDVTKTNVNTVKDTSYEQYIQRNNISEITATGYGYKFGEPTEGNTLYKVKYNKQGYLIDSLLYHKNGVMATLHNTYNDQNKLLLSEIMDSVGNVQQVVERSFDENGNVLSFQLKQNEVVLYSQKMQYESDRITKITEFDENGAPQIITNYVYNKNGDLIEDEQADALGNILEKTVFVYDDKGRNTVQTIYGSDGQVIEKNFLKQYDKNDNSQLIEKYDKNDSLIVTYTYEYNEKGEETKSIIYDGVGQIIRQSMATLDANGDQVMYEVYEGGKGLIGKDERKYNDNHQEVELIVYDHKENQLKRKVSYYNDKGLLSEVINYDKIDEPLFRMTYDYKFHDK